MYEENGAHRFFLMMMVNRSNAIRDRETTRFAGFLFSR
jgi:hypothetical protein